jgi:NTE family protein
MWPARLLACMLLVGCSSVQNAALPDVVSVRTLDEVGRIAKPLTQGSSSRPVVGLALGGGGLRGYAHVGVLQALEEAGIEVDVVVGTSAGAVIGAAYASGRPASELRQLATNLDVTSLTDWRLSTASFMRGDALIRWGSAMAQHMPIEAMPRRFGAVAAGLDSGVPLLMDRGDVGLAIRASAAVPGAMEPVASNRELLVDGGIASLVPVRFARAMGADIVIGVDIYCHSPAAEGGSLLTTFAKVARIQTCLVSRAEMAEADVLMAPSVKVDDMKSATQREEAIQAGYRAAREALPRLLTLTRVQRDAEQASVVPGR